MANISMGPITSLGVLIEELGLWKIGLPDEAHVPFSIGFNGMVLGFVLPDKVIWGAIVFSLLYSALKMGVLG
jgi:hypothetical protein